MSLGLLFLSSIPIQFRNAPDAIRRYSANERRRVIRKNSPNCCPVLDENRSPYLRILVVLRKEEHSAVVFPDGLHANRIFQNPAVWRDRHPPPLAARCQPHVISLVAFEILIVDSDYESFSRQRSSQLLAPEVAIEKEDVGFRLLERIGLPLQPEGFRARSLRQCAPCSRRC